MDHGFISHAVELARRRRWRRGRRRRAFGRWRRRWRRWWRRRSPPVAALHPRDLISLRVHALLVGHIVASLHLATRVLRATGPDRRTEQEAASGAGGGPDAGTARRGADRRACCGPEGCADRGAGDTTPTGRFTWGRPRLLVRKLSAHSVIALKLLERLPAARQ